MQDIVTQKFCRISTHPFLVEILYRSMNTGVTPHKSKVDNAVTHGQFLPYHTMVTDVSFKERSTWSMMYSFPLFSFSTIAQPKPDILQKEGKLQIHTSLQKTKMLKVILDGISKAAHLLRQSPHARALSV